MVHQQLDVDFLWDSMSGFLGRVSHAGFHHGPKHGEVNDRTCVGGTIKSFTIGLAEVKNSEKLGDYISNNFSDDFGALASHTRRDEVEEPAN